MRKSTTTILIMMLLAAAAFSQTPSGDCTDESTRADCKAAIAKQRLESVLKAVSEAKVNLEIAAVKAKLSATEFGTMSAPIKGAPYSAEAITESVLTLGDGNRIRHSSTVQVFRDGEGRIARQDNAAHQTVIMDPVASVRWELDTEKQTAYERPLAMSTKDFDDKIAAEIYARRLADMKRGTPEAVIIKPEKQPGRNESLGQKLIEGLTAQGTRSTVIIPADTIGNELPIQTFSERWFSPDLKIDIQTERNDPRTGDVTFRLTNIHRGEPDPSVFQIPSGFLRCQEAHGRKEIGCSR